MYGHIIYKIWRFCCKRLFFFLPLQTSKNTLSKSEYMLGRTTSTIRSSHVDPNTLIMSVLDFQSHNIISISSSTLPSQPLSHLPLPHPARHPTTTQPTSPLIDSLTHSPRQPASPPTPQPTHQRQLSICAHKNRWMALALRIG